ncbi:MAG: undecaprenyldiphospho-muramoylpentapeptide beta-N-acetylglucosaminyltransferase [Candidatus Hydrogenedens sp.]|nr:undecaprenyldiphospho-muramoylpentapeptide beta-N-acetylglucosaminyltransferase [Candidatus Hydrogenedens sp.]
MRILITGGGTGGHTSPASAVIEELRRRDPQLLLQWAGKRGAIEERVAKSLGVPFRAVPSAGWPRKRGPRQAWVALKMAVGTLVALRSIRSFQPQIVFGVGGYVSLPAMLAAQELGVPVMLHEQNKRLGKANGLMAPKAARVFLSFPDSIGSYPAERAMVVGNPVRAAFLTPPSPAEARKRFELAEGVPVVLVVGGSQGAKSINQAVAEVVQGFGERDAQFIWMTGRGNVEAAYAAASKSQATVRVYEFIDDMAVAASAADVILSRAGASSTAEIAALGKPSVLVPFPFATDDHQTRNAEAFVEAGAAVLLPDAECTGARLAEELRGLLRDPERRARMGDAARTLSYPNAAEAIVEAMLSHVFEGGR